MEFRHGTTKRLIMMVDIKPHMDDALKIEDIFDLPSISFWKDAGCLPPEIVEHQGLTGINAWLTAFLDGHPKIYYISLFPSGFPDGILPKFTRGYYESDM